MSIEMMKDDAETIICEYISRYGITEFDEDTRDKMIYIVFNNKPNFEELEDVLRYIDKSHQNKKVDSYLQMFEKNFNKSYSDIINNLKAYSSIGNSTVGGMLITHATRKNMYRNKKYLL